MRKPSTALGIVLLTLIGCGPQEPAVGPLAAPPPADESLGGPPSAAAEPAKAPAAPAELTPEQSAKLYQDCWAAFNAKDFVKFSACYSDNATSEQADAAGPALVGRDIVEKGAKQFATAFPEATGEAQLTLVNGNNVVGVWLLRGANKGPLSTPTGELPATNKKIGFLMGHVTEVKGGKVARELQYTDARTLLGQLGIVPGPVRKVMDQGTAEKPLVIATNSEAEKANAETLKKYYDAFNKHDAAGLDALLADDFIFSDQTAPADLVGKKEAQRGYKELFKGISDIRVESKTAWPAGDYVVSQSSFSGTNDGPLPSMKLWKKTDKRVSVSALDIVKVQGGKLKNHWRFSNGIAFVSQLGLLPPAKDAAKAQPAADKGAKSNASKPAAGAAAPAAAGKTDATAKSAGAPGASSASKADSAKTGAAVSKPDSQKAAEAPKAKATSPAPVKPSDPAKASSEPAAPKAVAPAAPKAPAPAAPAPAPAPAKPAPTPAK